MNAKPEMEPSVVGVRVRPVWSIVLYVLLVVSAGVAMYAQRTPGIEPGVARAAPWIFLVFGLGFAIYRVALVAARRYSPFKAFAQILLAALFFLLLLYPRVQSPGVKAGSLMTHADSRVRALAAEVTGFRGDQTQAARLVKLLEDDEPLVRDAAHTALVKLNGGVDLGPSDDANARDAWRARFP